MLLGVHAPTDQKPCAPPAGPRAARCSWPLQALIIGQYASVLLGLGLLAWLVAMRHTQPGSWWFLESTFPAINLALSCLCLAALLAAGCLYVRQCLHAHWQQRKWWAGRMRRAGLRRA